MRVTTIRADEGHCVRNVAMLASELVWDSVGVGYALVVCGRYGAHIEIDDELRAALGNLGASLFSSSGTPFDLGDGRSVALLRRGAIRSDSYRCTRRFARYAVFGCAHDMTSDELMIYVPGGAEAAYDVPGVVRVSVSPYWTERGADGFGRFTRVFDRAPERVLACYLMSVTLDGEVPESDETWLWYEFEGTGLRFPITREMLGKTMCVRPLALQGGSGLPPVVKSQGQGYEVITA